MVTRGYYINFVEFQGYTPAIFGQKGELARPLLRGGAGSANNVPETGIETAGVLGMACGHLARTSELDPEPVGARGNASRGRILPIPPDG